MPAHNIPHHVTCSLTTRTTTTVLSWTAHELQHWIQRNAAAVTPAVSWDSELPITTLTLYLRAEDPGPVIEKLDSDLMLLSALWKACIDNGEAFVCTSMLRV